MSFKDFVMSADPLLVIPRALSLNIKKDNILLIMATNIQKMNPSLDLINTLRTPRPNSPYNNNNNSSNTNSNMLSSENDDDISRSVSPLIFENNSKLIENDNNDYKGSADSEKDLGIVIVIIIIIIIIIIITIIIIIIIIIEARNKLTVKHNSRKTLLTKNKNNANTNTNTNKSPAKLRSARIIRRS